MNVDVNSIEVDRENKMVMIGNHGMEIEEKYLWGEYEFEDDLLEVKTMCESILHNMYKLSRKENKSAMNRIRKTLLEFKKKATPIRRKYINRGR